MSTKRVLLVILVASVAILAAAVQAQPAAKEASLSGVTIPYSGRLADETGRWVTDGAYDFTMGQIHRCGTW